MIIQRTTSDDVGFKQLVAALDSELWGQYGKDQALYAPHNKIEHNKHVAVARIENEAVGCACFKQFNETTVEIKRMYVKPGHRGQRIAEALLHELHRWAIEEGYVHAVLETGNLQKEALRLYERNGYTRTENYEPYVGMPASVCMQKSFE